MKLFLHINIKKIETVIPYVDNYLWNVGIQKKSNKLYHMRNDPSIFNKYSTTQLIHFLDDMY